MTRLFDLRAAMDVVNAANERVLSYVPGTRVFELGRLRCIHYDRPLWWETEAFQALEVEPQETVAHVQAYHPGPHLIAVICSDPESVIAPYTALGYKTVPNEPVETVMARDLSGFVPIQENHVVQCVQTEAERQFYNSVIDEDDPHGQIKAAEMNDPELRYYYVEQDGQCVCTGRAILPGFAAVNVEPLGTHAAYRRRGIATALMHRLHRDAVELGARQSVIVATAMGKSLYTTLGYTIVGYIQKFVPQDWNRANLGA